MRNSAMSKGPGGRGAYARAITINEVQMVTVMTEAARPTALGDKPGEERIPGLSRPGIIAACCV